MAIEKNNGVDAAENQNRYSKIDWSQIPKVVIDEHGRPIGELRDGKLTLRATDPVEDLRKSGFKFGRVSKKSWKPRTRNLI